MLLAGLRPPEGCTELPEDGGIGLNGTVYGNTGNIPFLEARKTLKEWRIWCDDWTERVAEDGRAALFDDDPFVIPEGASLVIPDRLVPFEFIKWFVEFQVKERASALYDYQWVPAFKELVGYPPENPYVPFGVALYSDELSRPLDAVLSKLNQLTERYDLSSTSSSEVTRLSKSGPAPILVKQGMGKGRWDALDDVVEVAIKKVESERPATVWQELKELALNSQRPFTGFIDPKGGLQYNKDSYEDGASPTDTFTKDALEARLRRRKKRHQSSK